MGRGRARAPAKRRYELTESGHELLRAWAKALGADAERRHRFHQALREGGEVMHGHGHHRGPRRPPFGRRWYSQENVLERLENYQRDLEQELADVERPDQAALRDAADEAVEQDGLPTGLTSASSAAGAKVFRPSPPRAPSSSSRSASARCASALPRSAGSACGSRRGRRSSTSAPART